MAHDVKVVLEAAALGAFEQLGFLLADPEPAESSGPWTAVRVDFEGPTRGAVVVRADATLLRVLSMSMLGSDELPTAALQRDALGEMANVICGNAVYEAGDKGADFRLGAPARVDEAVAADAVRGSVRLGFEGGVAEVDWVEASP